VTPVCWLSNVQIQTFSANICLNDSKCPFGFAATAQIDLEYFELLFVVVESFVLLLTELRKSLLRNACFIKHKNNMLAKETLLAANLHGFNPFQISIHPN